MCPCTMNCRACFIELASPCLCTWVWSLLSRNVVTSSERMSSSTASVFRRPYLLMSSTSLAILAACQGCFGVSYDFRFFPGYPIIYQLLSLLSFHPLWLPQLWLQSRRVLHPRRSEEHTSE